jgi:glycosyltransferase involved in cell wall biosynthesis
MQSAQIYPNDVLFVGNGNTANSWYRCFLPAIKLQTDWAGIIDEPGGKNYYMLTGSANNGMQIPHFDKYKIVVLQMPFGLRWATLIKHLRNQGIKVLYEIDDDLHAIAKMPGHTYAEKIRKRLRAYELCMGASDGIITATDFLADRLRKFNSNVWVCENHIDVERYQLSRNRKDSNVVIGFSGGIGHENTLNKWLEYIKIATEDDHVEFMSIGARYGDLVPGGKSIPFVQVEQYPGALSNFDISLAPGADNNFFRAKGQLKWIEASALGIPTIAFRTPYVDIVNGQDGIVVNDKFEFRDALCNLINDGTLRKMLGENARARVIEEYNIERGIQQWINVFESLD